MYKHSKTLLGSARYLSYSAADPAKLRVVVLFPDSFFTQVAGLGLFSLLRSAATGPVTAAASLGGQDVAHTFQSSRCSLFTGSEVGSSSKMPL